MLKNNQFTSDNDLDRLERLLALSANIDALAADLGLVAPDDLLTWAQGSGAVWESADASATVEDGQMDEAFETYANKVLEVYGFYTGARELLMSYITQFENPNDLAKAYGFEGDSPRTGKGLVAAISAWEDHHDFMIAEGLTPVLNATDMTKLLDYETELKSFLNITKIEKKESRAAYKAKAALFVADSKKLTILFNIAKFKLGDDDDRLGLLGFVPSSEVWTPGDPEEPGEPEPVFPEAFEEFKAIYYPEPSPMNVVGWKQYGDCDFGRAVRAKVPIGDPVPERPLEIWQEDVTDNPIADQDVEPGYIVYYWVCAVKDGIEGEFAECSCEYPM